MPTHRFALAILLLFAAGGAARAATPEQVDSAIARGVQYLYAHMNGATFWETAAAPDYSGDRHQDLAGYQWGGLSALSTLTILTAGENPADPRVEAAVNFLRHADIRGNYPESVRSQIWQYLPLTHENKQAIEHDFELTLNAIHPNGFYGYYTAGVKSVSDAAADTWYDHSNSQLAVLGMWALAETYVVEVPRAYWELVDQAWKGQQWADGAWSYNNIENHAFAGWEAHNFNMTAAGVATLLITQDWLRTDVGCHGNSDSKEIEAGIRWTVAHVGDAYNNFAALGPGGIRYYGTYGLERVGQASGRKYLGAVDWFKTVADRLVKEQGGDGGWNNQIVDTCFAVLTLAHGRAPIAFNKLEYRIDFHGDTPKDANWNQRPHDAANLARWIGHAEELDFGWQIVNLDVPQVELHDAPILYIAGNQSLDFTAEEQAKLKAFVEEGGLILFNADCAGSIFSRAVEHLGTKLFPQSEFRELPEDHPIYTSQQFPRARWNTKPSIKGLSNGARELMILIPSADPARFWQARTVGGREEFHYLGADIFQYMVTNPNKLKKGRNFIVTPDGAGGGPAIKIARLQYPGMWDPEPGGWRRLAAIMHNQGRAELSVETVDLANGKLAGYQIAHITGTYAMKLPDAARAQLKDFVAHGGTLIVDACGGSGPFSASMDNEMTAIFGAGATALKADHPVYAAPNKLDKVEYRRFATKTLGKLATGRLRGLQGGGRTAVFVSNEDLSVGLVGVPVDGIYGYQPETAVSLMENMILYAANGPPAAPATAP